MDVVLVVDMQEASVSGDDKHDIAAMVDRINNLMARVRARGGRVLFIQHDGTAEEGLVPHSTGWVVATRLKVAPQDRFVRKTLNDPFQDTSLDEALRELGASRLIVSGWATDFCVDATVRSAMSRGYEVIVASDGHTLNDRPHLRAAQVIEHHNWVWANLIATAPVRVMPAREI